MLDKEITKPCDFIRKGKYITVPEGISYDIKNS
jgi:hypothetical protein